MAEIVHPRCLSACASTSSPVENMGGGSLRWSVSEPPASGGAPPDWWTIEAQAVPGGWGVSVIESGESYVILNSEAGVMGNRVRVLDSTPVYDSVATQDTVTQLRSAIRKLLRALDRDDPLLAAKVRAVLARDDDYAGPGKPVCDWDDPAAREALVDALVRDCGAALAVLDGGALEGPAADAVELLALVAGQDVEAGDDGTFRIARRVAPDRVISTVDVEARHGHRSHDRRFDGYKAHLSVDPDSELIDEVVVTAANVHDSTPVTDLLAGHAADQVKPTVMGDCAYGTAETLARLADAGYDDVRAKVAPARGREGRFGKDDFAVDLEANTVTCPAGKVVGIRTGKDGSGRADFGPHCTACPLRESCTTSTSGRTVTIHPRADLLQEHKAAQASPDWQADYTATRPKVERKIAHFVRRGWGGRRARVRGKTRIATDADTRAAAVNWARLATLGVCQWPRKTPRFWPQEVPAGGHERSLILAMGRPGPR